MGHKRTRLRDIAEKTGFSANTVSLALRDSPRIPEATRNVIKAVAHELHYMPNRIAQSLVSQRSMMIGLVLTNLRNPILTQVAEEVSRVLAEQGYATMFATSSRDVAKEQAVIATLRERQCDGILIFPTDHGDVGHLHRLREIGYPLVSFVPDPDRRIDCASSNDELGAAKATAHLLASGRRKIALLDAATPLGNTEKRDGYRKSLEAAGLSMTDDLLVNVPDIRVTDGFNAMEILEARGIRPDAVVATNDSLAVGVELWCQRHRIKVPDAVAVVGFDDIEFARLAAVPVSTIAYPVEIIVRAAVTRLLELIAVSGTLPAPTQTMFEPELLVRASTSTSESHD